jgi:hypothetical protein
LTGGISDSQISFFSRETLDEIHKLSNIVNEELISKTQQEATASHYTKLAEQSEQGMDQLTEDIVDALQ